MSDQVLLLSDKYKAFIRHEAPFEVLEGVTAAGKTTVGLFKFMLKVAESPKKLHILAARTTGVAEKNIINKDLGICDDFGPLVEYNGNGNKDEKLPHILYHTSAGDKVIYVMGYADKNKWENALGGQYGCLYIDEVNTANIDFVRESTMRADYVMATLNPDAPDLPIYKEYVNCCRPLKQYIEDAPAEINAALNEVPAKEGWTHWFFNFIDNLGLSEEKRNQIINNVPVGTKLYKNKILGLRGKATGLVFANFNRKRHLMTKEQAKSYLKRDKNQKEYFVVFTSGMDTAYSSQSPDTIAMSFAGITNKGKYILLDEKVYNNKTIDEPIAPSDTVSNYIDFLERNRKEWGFAKNVFIDSADQATITELGKYKRVHQDCLYMFNNAYKKVTIVDRIKLQLSWMICKDRDNNEVEPYFYVVDTCTNYISELESYSWKEDKDEEPEDGHDHMVNSVQYSWIPHRERIGVVRNEGNNGRKD